MIHPLTFEVDRKSWMKTAGKEHPKRCRKEAASRVLGTEGQNNPAQTGRAGRQEKIQLTEKCSFLTSTFIELRESRRPVRALLSLFNKIVPAQVADVGEELPL